MSVTLPEATRNEIADLVVDKVDTGTTNAAGKLRIKDSGGNTLVDCNLSNPAFGDAAAGVATANAIFNGTASASGQASTFDVLDRDETLIFSGTVTANGDGGDLESDSNSVQVTSGGSISITSFKYRVANPS